MIFFVPSSKFPASTQCQVSGFGLLTCTSVGLGLTITAIFQHPAHAVVLNLPGRTYASELVVAVCVLSALFGVLLSRMYWRRSRRLLRAAELVSTWPPRGTARSWDGILALLPGSIAVGLLAAFTQHSLNDLAMGTVVLATAGTASLALGRRVRRLERRNRVLYYCLADATGKWRLVKVRQDTAGARP